MVVVCGTAQWLSRCLLAMRQYENRRAKSNHTVIARSEATRQSVLFYRAGGLGAVKLDADSHDQCEHWSRNDSGFLYSAVSFLNWHLLSTGAECKRRTQQKSPRRGRPLCRPAAISSHRMNIQRKVICFAIPDYPQHCRCTNLLPVAELQLTIVGHGYNQLHRLPRLHQ